MKKQDVLLGIWFLAVTFAFSSCQKSEATSDKLELVTLTPNEQLSIKDIDFKNFTYPWTKEQELDEKEFTLKDGKKETNEDKSNGASFSSIEFGDVTNDGEEEAVISISPITGGNCSCNMIYIYSLQNGNPKLLWSFDTNDRADGGFKRAYAEDGNLIIETFGDNKFEDGKWDFNLPENGAKGLCCPTAYTKIHFRWNGRKFEVEGKPELFDYDWRNQLGESK